MIRIWAINFANFGGAGNDEPQDVVGNQHLTVLLGTPLKTEPLPGFTNRPGIQFESNGFQQRYQVNLSGATNGIFRGSYSTGKRSFEMWFYYPGTGVDGLGGHLWGDHDGFSMRTGFQMDSSGNFRFYNNSGFVHSVNSISTGWHHVVMTIDRPGVDTQMYFDGVWVDSDADVPQTTTGNCSIGDNGNSRESNCSMGWCATYDHILSSGEVSQLYDSFLIDSPSPDPYATINGIVYDNDLNRLEDADILVFDHLTKKVADITSSDENGLYIARFPSIGQFSVYTTKSGTPGGRASTVTVTSGGNVIINDDL